MFTLLCAISIQILKFFCKDRRLLLYMSRTLHLFGTDWCAMMVPIQVIRWYRMQCYDGTDSCATVVPIRRYCHSVTLSPRSRLLPRRKSKTYDAKVSYLRYESQGLMMQKSVTCDAKVSYLRPVIHWLTTRITSVNSFKIKQAMEIEVTSGANRVRSVTFIFMLIL